MRRHFRGEQDTAPAPAHTCIDIFSQLHRVHGADNLAITDKLDLGCARRGCALHGRHPLRDPISARTAGCEDSAMEWAPETGRALHTNGEKEIARAVCACIELIPHARFYRDGQLIMAYEQ